MNRIIKPGWSSWAVGWLLLSVSAFVCFYCTFDLSDRLNGANVNSLTKEGLREERGTSSGGRSSLAVPFSFSTSINGMHFNPFNYGSLPQLPQIKLLCKPRKDT